jgi:outer membrane protein assembly factor BamB
MIPSCIVVFLIMPTLLSFLAPINQGADVQRHSRIDYPQQCNYVPPPMEPISSDIVRNGSEIYQDVTITDNGQWPQQGYTEQHIGRSPYSTATNPGIEIWRYPAKDWCDNSPVIGADGTIYFGSEDHYFYAITPEGYLKWKHFTNADLGSNFGSHPAIAPNGTIYIGTFYSCTIFALNSDGTELWHIGLGRAEVSTSITLDKNGILYYGHDYGVDARYPNGTLKWRFNTQQPDSYVQSTPAIDQNGIIYFGSHDRNFYALYPNGTIEWTFPLGNWGHGSPTIAPDGTIYVGCDTGYLYALNPDGTMRWRTMVGAMRSSPSLDKQGNLYFGVWDSRITSVAPNGTIRWQFPLRDGDRIWGSTAAISDDGTIYIGNSIDFDMNGAGEILALSLNGTLKWRKTICDLSLTSSPVIAADGTVYICSSSSSFYGEWGSLHAFGAGEPRTIEITRPIPGHLYLFNIDFGKIHTSEGNTIIIGDVTVKVNVGHANDLERLNFYTTHTLQYNLTQQPFQWKMNKRYDEHPLTGYALIIKAQYKNGCEYTAYQGIWYFHLKRS